jgi:hypothetical protein
VVSRAVGALLRHAARRWPEDARDDAAREWAAEVHEIRRTGAPGMREARALRFAASLAVSRPPRADQLGAPSLLRVALPAVQFLLAPLFCAVVVVLAAGAAQPLIDALRSWTGGSAPDVAGNVLLLSLVCAATALAGRALGARSAVRAASPRFTAVILAALLTVGTAAAAPIAMTLGSWGRRQSAALVVWLPVLALACLLALRGRRLASPVVVTVGGVYLTVEAFTRLNFRAPGLLDPWIHDRSFLLWSPATLLPRLYFIRPGTPLSHQYWSLFPVLLLGTAAFAIGYLRAAGSGSGEALRGVRTVA